MRGGSSGESNCQPARIQTYPMVFKYVIWPRHDTTRQKANGVPVNKIGFLIGIITFDISNYTTPHHAALLSV